MLNLPEFMFFIFIPLSCSLQFPVSFGRLKRRAGSRRSVRTAVSYGRTV
jgi:hypothetical protein